jgi:hypothetical protein
MPASGCSQFEREVGADDEPDQAPAEFKPAAAHAGPWKAQEVPEVAQPVQWAGLVFTEIHHT